jgi:hypothetical protein
MAETRVASKAARKGAKMAVEMVASTVASMVYLTADKMAATKVEAKVAK